MEFLQKHKTAAQFVIISLTILSLMHGLRWSLGKWLEAGEDGLCIISPFQIEQVDHNSESVTQIDDNRFVLTTTIEFDRNKIQSGNQISTLVIGGITCDGYLVTLNGRVIDEVGDIDGDYSNIWNHYRLSRFNASTLEDENELTLEIYSDEIIMADGFPLVITDSDKGMRLYMVIDFLTSGIFVLLLAINVFFLIVHCLQMKLVHRQWYWDNALLLLSFGALSLSNLLFIRLDYMPVNNDLFIHGLGALFVASFLIYQASIAIRKGYDTVKILLTFIVICGVLISVFMYGIHYFKWMSLLVTLSAVGFIFTFMQLRLDNRPKTEGDEIALLGISALILFLSVDLVRLNFSPVTDLRFAVDGLVLFNVSLLFSLLCSNKEALNRVVKERNTYMFDMYRYKEQKDRDGLTGLYNHKRLYGDLRASGMTPMSLLFIDLDDFKRVNDTFGHREGDLVLQHLANLLLQEFGDSCYRYGGEEFVVVLKNASEDRALEAAEKVRQQCIRDISVLKTHIQVTVSIGIASYPQMADDYIDLIEKADIAMYYAKNNGKNQSIIYSEASWNYYKSKV